MKTNIPTLEELEAKWPNVRYLTREELAQYVWILSRSQAIDECSKLIAQITGVDAGAVVQ